MLKLAESHDKNWQFLSVQRVFRVFFVLSAHFLSVVFGEKNGVFLLFVVLSGNFCFCGFKRLDLPFQTCY